MTVLKGEKFTVALSKGRPDPIKVTIINRKGKKASHHLRPTEVDVLIFALRRAMKRSGF